MLQPYLYKSKKDEKKETEVKSEGPDKEKPMNEKSGESKKVPGENYKLHPRWDLEGKTKEIVFGLAD